MAIYCGVDFRPRRQAFSYCDAADGEVIIGLEASGYSARFKQLLAGMGHRVWLGDAAKVRRRAKRRQKNDRRDAERTLDLLLKGEFPRVHWQPPESLEVLRRLRYRRRLIRMRTQVKNSLRAPASPAPSSPAGSLTAGGSYAARLKRSLGRHGRAAHAGCE